MRLFGNMGKGWIVTAAIVLVLVGVAAGLALSRRTPEPSQAPHSGPPPQMAGASRPGPNPQLQSLARQLEREDAPTQKLLDFAHQALDQQQFALAIPAYRRVLAREPRNPEALTHMGLILYRANHVDQALARIDEALKADPRYAHAHWDRAHILYETKRDPTGAAKSLEAFIALVPQGPDADRARSLLAELRRSGAPAKP